MKKIILAIISVIILASCSEEALHNRHQEVANECIDIVEIEKDGHVHEWIWYSSRYNSGPGGHWPDCKYCKEIGNN